ncbi:hypothetical protein CLOM_g673 [Closterium sp. NIES-68]|nr:hypothetical protein CLOM_g673 [Closterium sp. NIES-68]GJP57574.1 hypothetical protein CLOP_g19868 [Closterium sp. NIES-67]GJP82106.1 hypothetical protein CLOP_g12323 [Closterium sp. NIES-67]
MAEEEELAMGSDDEADAESPEEILGKIQDRSQRVNHFLSEGRVPEALKAAVSDPPIATRDQTCKVGYLYRALRTGEAALCARALRVHEKLTEKAGLGCIMRVMADRKHTV